jgi:SAM-dependent methyltransferase
VGWLEKVVNMHQSSILALNQINLEFYQTTIEFLNHSDNVYRLGWDSLIEPIKELHLPISLLDIGCGDGRFGVFLKQKGVDLNSYCGLDNSVENLEIAKAKLSTFELENLDLRRVDFIQDKNWDKNIVNKASLTSMLGVIHNIPSQVLRLEFFQKVCNLLKSGDVLIWSVFQYLDIPRLKRQVLDLASQENQDFFKAEYGLDLSNLEFGDNILEWKKILPDKNTIKTYRYSHYFSQLEIQDLIQAGNLRLTQDFIENGKEGGTNRYFICIKK